MILKDDIFGTDMLRCDREAEMTDTQLLSSFFDDDDDWDDDDDDE